LQERGLTLWIDEGLHGGEVVLKQIEREIEGSRHFLACLSSHYESSEWTQHELTFARTLGLNTRRRKVICVRLDHHPVPKNIAPYKWRTWWSRNQAELMELVADLLPEQPHASPSAGQPSPESDIAPPPRTEWGSAPGQRPIPVILAGCGYWARKRTVLP